MPQRLIEAFDQTSGGHHCKDGIVGYRSTQTLKSKLLKSHSANEKNIEWNLLGNRIGEFIPTDAKPPRESKS